MQKYNINSNSLAENVKYKCIFADTNWQMSITNVISKCQLCERPKHERQKTGTPTPTPNSLKMTKMSTNLTKKFAQIWPFAHLTPKSIK